MENSCHVTIPQMSFLRQFFFFKFHIWPSSHVEFSNATKNHLSVVSEKKYLNVKSYVQLTMMMIKADTK
jgi:hypothetical protein